MSNPPKGGGIASIINLTDLATSVPACLAIGMPIAAVECELLPGGWGGGESLLSRAQSAPLNVPGLIVEHETFKHVIIINSN